MEWILVIPGIVSVLGGVAMLIGNMQSGGSNYSPPLPPHRRGTWR
jgi:hypothetical protein